MSSVKECSQYIVYCCMYETPKIKLHSRQTVSPQQSYMSHMCWHRVNGKYFFYSMQLLWNECIKKKKSTYSWFALTKHKRLCKGLINIHKPLWDSVGQYGADSPLQEIPWMWNMNTRRCSCLSHASNPHWSANQPTGKPCKRACHLIPYHPFLGTTGAQAASIRGSSRRARFIKHERDYVVWRLPWETAALLQFGVQPGPNLPNASSPHMGPDRFFRHIISPVGQNIARTIHPDTAYWEAARVTKADRMWLLGWKLEQNSL